MPIHPVHERTRHQVESEQMLVVEGISSEAARGAGTARAWNDLQEHCSYHDRVRGLFRTVAMGQRDGQGNEESSRNRTSILLTRRFTSSAGRPPKTHDCSRLVNAL